MQIHRLKIVDIPRRPLLQDLDIEFGYAPEETRVTPQCFIGVNGSGKSQLLETLAEIFLHLDRLYRSVNQTVGAKAPLLYELEYSLFINDEIQRVLIKQQKYNKEPEVFALTEDYDEVKVDGSHKIASLLPQKVIGYTSGDNETLSIPFLDYYEEYADYTARRALKKEAGNDYEPRLYLMDYSTNIGVVISNLLLNYNERLVEITNKIGIKGLRSFRLKVQLGHTNKVIRLTKDLQDWIENLRRSATCFNYQDNTRTYTLDFFNNQATRDALKYFFQTAISLYTALYKIELLNNLMIEKKYLQDIKKERRQRGLVIKPPTVPERDKVLSYNEVQLINTKGAKLAYINLSDGEHQFLNVFGTVLMTNFQNSLYLLDEPETHFNPKWRREFINELNQLTDGRFQAYFITSHSPFIVSDSKRDNVFVFNKRNGSLKISNPPKETYGSSFDYVLKIAFDMEETVSEKSLDEIRLLQQSDKPNEIEERLDDFGESVEKMYLYQRIEELKSDQSE